MLYVSDESKQKHKTSQLSSESDLLWFYDSGWIGKVEPRATILSGQLLLGRLVYHDSGPCSAAASCVVSCALVPASLEEK
jgi:hypothetical protein